MTNLFLAPRSNETSHAHFKSTIAHGIDYEIIKDHLDQEGKEILSKEKKIYAWGCSETQKSRWDRMRNGDLVLFYVKGTLEYVGEVIYKKINSGLSDALWKRKSDGKPWSCVFFLKNIREISIPIKVINELAGYKENNIVQGFMPLKESAVIKIIEEYGSIENFLNGSLKEGSSKNIKNNFNNILLSKKQIILYGPPGTGKTYSTKKRALELL